MIRIRTISSTFVFLVGATLIAAGCGGDSGSSGAGSGGSVGSGGKPTATAGAGRSPDVTAARTIALPGKQVYPEGIALDRAGKRMFVSSTTDGTILAGAVGARALQPLGNWAAGGPTTAVGIETSPDGSLWVAGGDTGKVWHLDGSSGAVISTHPVPGEGPSFVNDVAVGADGTAFFTDSMRPLIYHADPTAPDGAPLFAHADLSISAIQYEDGFNLNGIELSADGQYLLTVQSNTGKLYRVPTFGGAPEQVDLGDELLTGGDGLELYDGILYAVQGDAGEIATLRTEDGWRTAQLLGHIGDASLHRPTTAAHTGSELLVVNSQFDERESGKPTLPFTVSALTLR